MMTLLTAEDLDQYVAGIRTWRGQVESTLRAPDGWLSLTGLFELREGEQTAGSDATCDVGLPASAPARLGVITLSQGKVTLDVTTDVPVQVDGAVARHAELIEDGDGACTPTKVTVGTVTFFVHSYGDRRAIRVKDSQSPTLQAFKGRVWFEVNPAYRVAGRFVPYEAARALQVGSTVGTPQELPSPGEIEFELHGQCVSLVTIGAPGPAPKRVSILFRDATAGKQTYPAMRSLSVEIDAAGNADVDFNRAVNMPCAFTPYATCPLPPRQNVLAIPIEAGERYEH
jgi:uncharacterized protein